MTPDQVPTPQVSQGINLKTQLPVDKKIIQRMSAAIAGLSLVTLVVSYYLLPNVDVSGMSFALMFGLAVVFFALYTFLPRLYLNETFLMLGDILYIVATTYVAYLAGEYGILILFLYFVIIVADALKYPLAEYIVIVALAIQSAFFYIIVGAPFDAQVRIGILTLFIFCTASISIFVWYFVYQTIYERSMRYVLERKSHYLKAMNDHLEAVDSMRTSMLRVTSHEFQTPLTAINNSLTLLRTNNIGQLTPQQLELVQLVTQNNQRLTQLVKNLLDAARIESGDWQLNSEDTDLVTLVHNLLTEYEPIIAEHGLTCVPAVPSQPVVAKVDPHLLQIAYKNILDNGVKYTPQGGYIYPSLTVDTQNITFAVQDTGIGIKPENIDHLFSQFYRTQESIAQKPDGYGIGLHHSLQIIKKHGGTINVVSQEGKGSKFSIVLPISITQQNPTPAVVAPPQPNALPPEIDTTASSPQSAQPAV